ncbi:bifunctional phosphoribosylaminoimidazole carboxylase/phosphoribosylaminoimidazole succinocarboxamide synthetase-like [Pyxicephalus adspersus]|uniref:bifunctional phosphoribosylaminoimidazole carboxylase/phosphoribosylaminoimidazole succinocarboxamide synthetase-like n=1 Tax=Pyxicephalus adspersus TaxID=30357 RepID=UPI003B5B0F0A
MLNEGINQKKSANVPENVFSLPTKHTDQSSFEDCTRSETSYHTMTTNCIFKLLQDAGIKTSVVTSSQECEIIPIEWACWRIATDMYLRRNPHAVEENRLSPPKVEMFWKNGDNNQLVISVERLVAAGISCAGLVLGQMEVDIMNRSIVAMLEILERTCLANGIVIVNLKVKFGVEANKKEIVLADVVGYESRSQIYTDILGQQNVECPLSPENQCKVVLLTESLLHLGYCEKIKGACAVYNIPCELRVISAYTGPAEILDLKSQYEGDVIPMVFITVAGKSNSLASVMSANITYPVINCPLVTAEWTAQDLCSAVRMAEGIGFSTVLSPEAAAQFAAHILGLSNPLLWSKLRTCTLNKWIAMKQADVKLRECSI